MRTVLAVSAFIFVALTGCGKPSYPDKPQLNLDRDSIGFAQEFGSGTYIGTKPQESLLIENGGLQDLVISAVTKSGADAAAFEVTGPTKTTLKGLERAYLRVVFAPTQVRNYAAEITIESNAENAPVKKVAITGRGVQPGTD